ncbi:hypothetical protein GCM10027299_39600 [Larkinella ripae]
MITHEVLSAISCVVPYHSATYVSVPITTGKRFLDWYENIGKSLSGKQYNDQHYQEVMRDNIANAQEFIQKLRQNYTLVIEPTSLNMAEWSQNDYHLFWQAVIDHYVREVYFLDGWEFSKGCTIEFMTGLRKGIPLYNQNRQEISAVDGLLLLSAAIDGYNAIGLDTSFHQNAVSEIKPFTLSTTPTVI